MMTRRQGLIGVMAVTAVVYWVSPAPAGDKASASQAFPATGQMSCWSSTGTLVPCFGTGQDGDIQAGATLSFTDNGDGTITDNNTNLVWEKQTRDGSIHDATNTYTWDNAFDVHIAGLNQMNFAGFSDWRVPNIKELFSILDAENTHPPVTAVFNAGCQAGCTEQTCSCTATSLYWSSTTVAGFTGFAWVMDFNFSGNINGELKGSPVAVRAVRGGSNLGPLK